MDKGEVSESLWHASLSYFAVDKLRPKGPRANADVGRPCDATRPLGTTGATAAGSWWCAAGGWPSPKQRTTTEIFHVFSGHGCLTDVDGQRHYFGPGDTVVLPKGWSGRWDVMEDIHKVWFVHDHPSVLETADPIRAKITHHQDLLSVADSPGGAHPDRQFPATASRAIYDVGPTVRVGTWTCTPGSFPAKLKPETAVGFFVLDGLFFLTDADGSKAHRCTKGDTVLLPKGWTGHWDVIRPVSKLWVAVE